ncbi:MAG: tyrosine--tRNA ligase [Alphaproteobacteria bacterium]|nr:tyrosine--tRNA ligase [Alphaproteobacteria bacterium]
MNLEETLAMLLKGAADGTPVADIREKLKKIAAEGRPMRMKLGLDPSAPDIHLGHAVVLRKIKQMQDLGHEATIIIGDFTGMIGDPSGKSKTRKQLTRAEVDANAETYKTQIFKILDPKKTNVRFNSEWLGAMTFRDVIELCAKTTVARILERDDFKSRYEKQQPIALHEFFYPMMQAYDSVVLKSDLEIGGLDQTFNILMGRNVQKDYGLDPQIALFMPLLEGTDGVEKMSKSLGNYIGVNEPAHVIYEKVMKVPDNLIIKYYDLATDKHPNDIKKIREKLDAGANPRDVKMDLAHEIVALYHGAAEADKAAEYFATAFQKQEIPDEAPVLHYAAADEAGLAFIDTLMSSGKYKSKSELRRLVAGGAVKVNGEKLTDLDALPNIADNAVVQVGKGAFYRIKR